MSLSTSESEVRQATTPASAVGKTLKKAEKKTSAKSKHVKPSHPPTSDMVNSAIKGLKERSGSSLHAIKKYIGSNYKVDSEKLAPFIRKFLKSAVQSGSLIQTKGKGASGSFKLAAAGSTTKASKKVAKKLVKSADRAHKNASPTKAADKKNKSLARSTSTVSKSKKREAIATEKKKPKLTKSPSKAKKAIKSPTKKPKAPKPKTVKSVTAAKKVTSPKKKK